MVLSDRDCTRGSREDHLYLSIRHLCLQEEAFLSLQRPSHFSEMMLSMFSDIVKHIMEV